MPDSLPVCECLRKCKMGLVLFFSSIGQRKSVCCFFFSVPVPRCGVDPTQLRLPGQFTWVALRGLSGGAEQAASGLPWHSGPRCVLWGLRLWHTDSRVWASVVMAHALSCSMTSGILDP